MIKNDIIHYEIKDLPTGGFLSHEKGFLTNEEVKNNV